MRTHPRGCFILQFWTAILRMSETAASVVREVESGIVRGLQFTPSVTAKFTLDGSDCQ